MFRNEVCILYYMIRASLSTSTSLSPEKNHRSKFVSVCVECLIGKQKKPILFQVTEPSSIPYRTHSACAKRAAYPDPPPEIPVPDPGVAQVTTSGTEFCG